MPETIVSYSIEIVNMSEMTVAETNRVKLYADYLVRYRADMLRAEEIDAESFDSTIEEVGRQEDPNLEALRGSGVIWTPEIIPEGRPARDDLRMIGTHLENRLAALQLAQQAIEPNPARLISLLGALPPIEGTHS